MREVSKIDEVEIMRCARSWDPQNVLKDMHQRGVTVQGTVSHQTVEHYNRKTNVRAYNPILRDYVPAAQMHGPRTKVSTNWMVSLYVSLLPSDFTVEAKHLMPNEKNLLHVWRVKPYSDAWNKTRAVIGEMVGLKIQSWHSEDCIANLKSINCKLNLLIYNHYIPCLKMCHQRCTNTYFAAVLTYWTVKRRHYSTTNMIVGLEIFALIVQDHPFQLRWSLITLDDNSCKVYTFYNNCRAQYVKILDTNQVLRLMT